MKAKILKIEDIIHYKWYDIKKYLPQVKIKVYGYFHPFSFLCYRIRGNKWLHLDDSEIQEENFPEQWMCPGDTWKLQTFIDWKEIDRLDPRKNKDLI